MIQVIVMHTVIAGDEQSFNIAFLDFVAQFRVCPVALDCCLDERKRDDQIL